MSGITGRKTAIATRASCHEDSAMMTRVTTTIVPLMIQEIAPHCANWARVSISLVTRVTRMPRFDSLWCAISRRCTWVNTFTRSPYNVSCALRTSLE